MHSNKLDKYTSAWHIHKYFMKHPEEAITSNITAILTATQYLFECEWEKKPDSTFIEIRDKLVRIAKQEPSEEFDKNYIDELLSQFSEK